jgi:hypothetical protein
MLTKWAREKVGPRWQVDEEVSLKDPANELNRRPDVYATDGRRRIAFEVEYKQFTPDHWAAKQADFDRSDIAGVWLPDASRAEP